MTKTWDQELPDGVWTGAMTAERVQDAARQLREGADTLRERSTTELAEVLGRVTTSWTEPGSPWMSRAREAVSASTGLSPAMVEWGLRDLFSRLTARSMAYLVEAELGARRPFSGVRSQRALPCARIAQPPELVFQVLAGTVPVVAIEAIVLALLGRAPLLLKTSRSEPVTARLFLESVRAIAPELARYVAVVTWPGHDDACNAAASAEADVVTAYGSTETIHSLQRHCRYPTRFFGYGNRVSFGVIGPTTGAGTSVELDQIASSFAQDVAAHDQRGCMSPHVIYVLQSAPWRAEAVGEALAERGLRWLAEAVPRGRLDDGVRAGMMQARGVAAFTGTVWENPGGMVLVHRDDRFRGSPGGRTVHVVPVEDHDALIRSLQPLKGQLSTVGLHHRRADRQALMVAMGRLGLCRVTRPGRMQRPLWIRNHDGRPRISDWIHWIDVEPLP